MVRVLRPVGVVASGSKSFYAPILVYKEAELLLREESLVVIKDRVTGRQYLGTLRWLSKIDPLLPATQRSGVVDNPKLAEAATNVPFETSYVKIVGEVRGSRLEPPADPPTPRSEVLLIESPGDITLDIGEGLFVGYHKYSGIRMPLDPKYLAYHVGVIGATGTGKSRLVKALIDEVLAKTDWRVIVFDHSGVDYVSYYPQSVVDASSVMPDPLTLGEIVSEISMLTSQSEYIISSIYAYIAYVSLLSKKTSEKESPQPPHRRGTIHSQPECGLDVIKAFEFTDADRLMTEIAWDPRLFTTCAERVSDALGARGPTLMKIGLLLQTYARGAIESLNKKKTTARDIVNKAQRERIVVVDLSTVDLRVRRYIVKSVISGLWDLVDERREMPKTLVVIDEAHNYACRECGTSLAAVERTAREGRKWQIGLVLASQRIIDFSTDIRNNINTFYFSRLQTPGDFDSLRGVLDLGGIGPETLSVLGTREFFFAGLGNPLRFPILIKVKEVGEPEGMGRAA